MRNSDLDVTVTPNAFSQEKEIKLLHAKFLRKKNSLHISFKVQLVSSVLPDGTGVAGATQAKMVVN